LAHGPIMASVKVDLGGSGGFSVPDDSCALRFTESFAVLLPLGVIRLTDSFLALSVLLLAAELEEL